MAEIGRQLKQRDDFLILGHVRPDGDSIGSQLALAHTLKALGKTVTLWGEDAAPGTLSFLPGAEQIHLPPLAPRDFGAVIALDCTEAKRLGTPYEMVGNRELLINVDHHPGNLCYGDLNYISAASAATGEILTELILLADLPLLPEAAEALFVAISTDTGSFQYPNTSVRTFEIAARLAEAGIDLGEINRQLYSSYPRRRIELLKELLGTYQLLCEGKLACFSLPFNMREAIDATPGDKEGLIDVIRGIDTVIVAVFFEEVQAKEIRISMRSKDPEVDVRKVCEDFGGGGHQLAAGARVVGELKEVETKILQALEKAIHAKTTIN